MAVKNLNDPKEYQEYMEAIAAKVKAIGHSDSEKHYIDADSVQISDNFRNLNSPAMIAMHINSDMWRNGNAKREQLQVIFYIVVKKNTVSDSNSRSLAQLAKNIVYQVLALMEKDLENEELLGFELDNVNVNYLGWLQEDTDWLGYRVSFPIVFDARTNLSYNADNYN